MVVVGEVTGRWRAVCHTATCSNTTSMQAVVVPVAKIYCRNSSISCIASDLKRQEADDRIKRHIYCPTIPFIRWDFTEPQGP